MENSSTPTLSVVPKRYPWFRQDQEGDKAYRAFAIFRDMSERTMIKSYIQYTGRVTEDRSYREIPAYFKGWFRTNRWITRARAFDEYNNVAELNKIDNMAAQRAEVWSKRRDELREEKYELGKMMFAQARQILEYPVSETVIQLDGITHITKPTKWMDKNVAATLAKSGCDLTSDISSVKIEISREETEGQPDLSLLSEDQLRNLRDLLGTASKRGVA